MVPPSEGGVVNNPSDNKIYDPASLHPGLVQGAARFSKLAAECPQMTGVVIDDFLQNYKGNQTGCVKCPKSHPHAYGNLNSGEFCCPWPIDANGHCLRPPDAPKSGLTECCIKPGSMLQCQGYARCGVNPSNRTVCRSTGEKTITLDDVIQIKCALLGKTVSPETGHCDVESVAKTPQLKLFLTWYTRFSRGYHEDGLLSGKMPTDGLPIVDGVSLWIEGLDQDQEYKNWTSEYYQFRQVTDKARGGNLPRLTTYGGSYIEHSRIGILPPGPFKNMINASIALYDAKEMSGVFFFAGGSLPKLNASMWKAYDLVSFMDTQYQPWVGSACGTVGTVSGRRVQVLYGNISDHPDRRLPVKGTLTGERRCASVGGRAAPHRQHTRSF